MNLSEIEIKFPDFKIDGRHGSRVGYWCVKCEKPITINGSNEEITWDSIAGLLKGTHITCGGTIHSIWEDDDSW